MPNGNQSGIELFAAAIAPRARRRYKYCLGQLGNIRYRLFNREGRALRECPRAIVKRKHRL